MTAYTLFSQPSSPATLASDNSGYTFGAEFSVSQAVPLTAIWFYSAPGAQGLPASIALFTVAGGALVHSEAAAWSGSAGSGWIRASFSSPPGLSAGVAYEAGVFDAGGGDWYSSTPHYWDTGPGAAGITNGILSAPGSAGTPNGQDAFTASSSLAFPAASFNASNYWLDPEVTLATSSAALGAQPLLSAQAVITGQGHGALAASPALATTAKVTKAAQAHLAASPSLAAAAKVAKAAQAHLAATSSLSSQAVIARTGHGVLAAHAVMSVTGTAPRTAASHLTAAASLAATGSKTSSVVPVAALGASSRLAAVATAGPDLDALWASYLALSEKARMAEYSYGMMRQAGGTDGSAGFLYGKAYEAQRAADQSYEDWRAARQRVYPGARG